MMYRTEKTLYGEDLFSSGQSSNVYFEEEGEMKEILDKFRQEFDDFRRDTVHNKNSFPLKPLEEYGFMRRKE